MLKLEADVAQSADSNALELSRSRASLHGLLPSSSTASLRMPIAAAVEKDPGLQDQLVGLLRKHLAQQDPLIAGSTSAASSSSSVQQAAGKSRQPPLLMRGIGQERLS